MAFKDSVNVGSKVHTGNHFVHPQLWFTYTTSLKEVLCKFESSPLKAWLQQYLSSCSSISFFWWRTEHHNNFLFPFHALCSQQDKRSSQNYVRTINFPQAQWLKMARSLGLDCQSSLSTQSGTQAHKPAIEFHMFPTGKDLRSRETQHRVILEMENYIWVVLGSSVILEQLHFEESKCFSTLGMKDPRWKTLCY